MNWRRFLENDFLAIALLGLLQGALSTLSLAPFNFPLLVWFAPWPLFYFAKRFRARPWMLLLAGAVSAFWLCVFSFYWMLHLFAVFGGLPLLVSILIFIPYTVVLNLKSPLFVLLFGLAHRTKRRGLFGPGFFVAALLATLTDYFTPQIFPWYWGNLLAGNPYLVQSGEVVGVYGLSFILFAGSYVLYQVARIAARSLRSGGRSRLRAFFQKGRLLRIVPVPAVILLLLITGAARRAQLESYQKQLPKVRVAGLQPNAPLERAGENRITAGFLRDLMQREIPQLAARTVAAGQGRIDLLVLPESAVPYYSTEDTPYNRASRLYSPDFARMVNLLALNHQTEVFYNEVSVRGGRNALGERAGLAYNSSALVARTGARLQTYDKQKLVAFGEYVPGVQLLKTTGLIHLVPGVVRGARFEQGAAPTLMAYSRQNMTRPVSQAAKVSPLEVGGQRPEELAGAFEPRTFQHHGSYLPLICYEVLSPELIRSFFLRNTQNPDFMVNITQDGWYGKTVETFQHFELGRMRAVETRRALVRSTNSGSSGMIDLAGNYAPAFVGPTLSEQEVSAFQIWDVPINRSAPTLYVRFGNLWLWLPVLLACALFLARRRKRVARTSGKDS